MCHVIIGTSGHIDHGKSALVRALTSHDPDRLKEEKKRGITIDLGFSWLELPDGTKSGIVDVPGHERFISNMLAGAGSVDLALLAVASDEGVMPQTIEHIGILQLLGIRHGVIALTRCDLADDELKILVEEDVRAHTHGTFLEDAPIVQTSSVTGEGIEALRETLFEVIRRVRASYISRVHLPFRLPVDRVFTMEGFGTVVTGTVTEGTLHAGDKIALYPGEKPLRVRTVEVHDQQVEKAEAGQRAALNLPGIQKNELSRGTILAESGSLFASDKLDVTLHAMRGAHFLIKNNLRVHVFLHTESALGRIVLLDRDRLEAGEQAPAQIRLETPLHARYGDHFIVRFYSPVETIGGGRVIDPFPPRRKRHHPDNERTFAAMNGDDPNARLFEVIVQHRDTFVDLKQAYYRAGIEPQDQTRLLETLTDTGDIFKLDDETVISDRQLAVIGAEAQTLLEQFYEDQPLEQGMRREELRTRLLPKANIRRSDQVIELLIDRATLVEQNGRIALPGRRIKLSQDNVRALKEIEAFFTKSAYNPPATDAWLNENSNPQETRQRVTFLLRQGKLVLLTPQMIMHRDMVDRALALALHTIEREGSLTLANFRTKLGTTRRYAVALLEYFDKIKATQMKGDVRVLGTASLEKSL